MYKKHCLRVRDEAGDRIIAQDGGFVDEEAAALGDCQSSIELDGIEDLIKNGR